MSANDDFYQEVAKLCRHHNIRPEAVSAKLIKAKLPSIDKDLKEEKVAGELWRHKEKADVIAYYFVIKSSYIYRHEVRFDFTNKILITKGEVQCCRMFDRYGRYDIGAIPLPTVPNDGILLDTVSVKFTFENNMCHVWYSAEDNFKTRDGDCGPSWCGHPSPHFLSNITDVDATRAELERCSKLPRFIVTGFNRKAYQESRIDQIEDRRRDIPYHRNDEYRVELDQRIERMKSYLDRPDFGDNLGRVNPDARTPEWFKMSGATQQIKNHATSNTK